MLSTQFSCPGFNTERAALPCDLQVPSKRAEQGSEEAWAEGTEQPDLSQRRDKEAAAGGVRVQHKPHLPKRERPALVNDSLKSKYQRGISSVCAWREHTVEKRVCTEGEEETTRFQRWLMLVRVAGGERSREMAGNTNLKQDNQVKWAFKNSLFSQTFQNRPSNIWVTILSLDYIFSYFTN